MNKCIYLLAAVTLFSCQDKKTIVELAPIESSSANKLLANARVSGSGANIAPPPLSTTIFKDLSGKITIKLYKSVRQYGMQLISRVSVENDYVLCGGGAFISNWSSDIRGAFIMESRPETNLREWVAQSSYIGVGECHDFVTYAYGIKIEGVSSEALRAKMKVFSQTSASSINPVSQLNISKEPYMLLGGGGKSNSNMPLLGSIPYGETWYAETMGVAQKGTVTAYAIGIDKAFVNSMNLSIKQVS